MTKADLIFLIERYGYARREGEHQGKKSHEWMHNIGDAIASLVAEAREPLVEALRAVEWIPRENQLPEGRIVRDPWCPECRCFKAKGHAPDCPLAAALAKETP